MPITKRKSPLHTPAFIQLEVHSATPTACVLCSKCVSVRCNVTKRVSTESEMRLDASFLLYCVYTRQLDKSSELIMRRDVR